MLDLKLPSLTKLSDLINWYDFNIVSKLPISIVFRGFTIRYHTFSILCFIFFRAFQPPLYICSIDSCFNSGRDLLQSYEVSLSNRVTPSGAVSGTGAGAGAGGYSRSKPSQQVQCTLSYMPLTLNRNLNHYYWPYHIPAFTAYISYRHLFLRYDTF